MSNLQNPSTESSNLEPVVPRAAATILLLRQGTEGIEVFMQQRNPKASFVGGAYVFPGGKVDAQDASFPIPLMTLPNEGLEAPLFLQEGGIAAVIAAVRECYEESGIFLAYDGEYSNKKLLSFNDEVKADFYRQHKQILYQGDLGFAEFCLQQNLTLALDKVAYISRWITPESSPQRFDTCFFVCEMPAEQEGEHDDYEAVASEWMRFDEALERFHQGDIKLIYPTVKTLEYLLEFSNIEDIIKHHQLTLSTLGELR